MVRRTQARKASLGSERLYFQKAEKFLEGAKRMLAQGNWESASSLAIHTVICSCDALTVKFLSRKHSGSDHLGIVDLLGELPLADKRELKSKKSQVRQIITLKTNVQYDHSLVKPDTAKKIVVSAERIFNWASKHI